MAQAQMRGLWPVMITPFTDEGEIDWASLERLIAWYESHGATGLFAACQSSEIFFLTLQERVSLVKFVREHAHIPVIASGHISYSYQGQLEELQAIAQCRPDALILITNRLVHPGAPHTSLLPALKALMKELPAELPLGFYECPYPFKRLITLEELDFCAQSGRFAFMKDTCCDLSVIGERLKVLEGSPLKLYNANTTTLLDSLRLGAAGFSGVMMNFHPGLYRLLMEIWETDSERAETLQSFLTVFSEIERQYYPVNAKFHLKEAEGILTSAFSRTIPQEGLTATFQKEVRQMHQAAQWVRKAL